MRLLRLMALRRALWGLPHRMASIGRSTAMASQKSAPEISSWAHGASAWLGQWCTSTRTSGENDPDYRHLGQQSGDTLFMFVPFFAVFFSSHPFTLWTKQQHATLS